MKGSISSKRLERQPSECVFEPESRIQSWENPLGPVGVPTESSSVNSCPLQPINPEGGELMELGAAGKAQELQGLLSQIRDDLSQAANH